jgi:hypothetical protein
MVHFQDSILEHLHHHTLFNMFSDGRLEAHCARTLSCFEPWGEHLAYNSTNFPNLLIIFPIFFHSVLDTAQTITSFNCRPPPMWVHISHRPYGYPPFTLCLWQ